MESLPCIVKENKKEVSMEKLSFVGEPQLKKDIPDFGVGDMIEVHVRVVEGEKERIQIFSGTVIRIKGSGIKETFTVRKIASGVGVERIFPIHSPMISKIVKIYTGKVRRTKLYYLRKLKGKAARIPRKY